MSKFITKLREMAVSTGINTRGFYSKEADWNKRDTRFVKLIKENINAKHHKIYTYAGSYILTDKEDTYLGALEFKNEKNTIEITASDSKMKGGFYLIIFSAILTFTKVKEIISGDIISEQAFKSYLNLTKGFAFDIKVLDKNNEYLEFSRETVFSSDFNRVSVREHGNRLKESFAKLMERVETMDSWKRWFAEGNMGLDQNFIYGESINHVKWELL